jgi:phospho-acceptor domain-containing protein
MRPDPSQPAIPVVLFEVVSDRLQLLNCDWEDVPSLSPNRWLGISRGGWRSLVPEEYHAEVEKLTMLPLSECYTVVEFPIYWQSSIKWLLVFAAAVAQSEGGRKVVGLVQDVTRDREWSFSLSSALLDGVQANDSEATLQPIRPPSGTPAAESAAESVDDLCHDLSGPLTSILMNCEMLMEDDCPPPVREKLAGIFSEAMQINQQLRQHRRP